MNPYLNSLNGFGGGFIAFWPSGDAVVEAAVARYRGLVVNVGRLLSR